MDLEEFNEMEEEFGSHMYTVSVDGTEILEEDNMNRTETNPFAQSAFENYLKENDLGNTNGALNDLLQKVFVEAYVIGHKAGMVEQYLFNSLQNTAPEHSLSD